MEDAVFEMQSLTRLPFPFLACAERSEVLCRLRDHLLEEFEFHSLDLLKLKFNLVADLHVEEHFRVGRIRIVSRSLGLLDIVIELFRKHVLVHFLGLIDLFFHFSVHKV